jgi:quinol monooxygenase YgiN
MLMYQMKIKIRPYKPEEFVDSMHSFLGKIRKQKDCHDFCIYRDSEHENDFIVIGEWNTRRAMDSHFTKEEFELLIGAAKVLGESFEMNIAEVLTSGGLDFARKQIKPAH